MNLPIELLVAIFRHLQPKERLTGPALVCHAWHVACHSPELIGTIEHHWLAVQQTPTDQAIQQLASFAAWLERHASAVGSLRWVLAWRDERQPEVQALVQRCTAACAAAGSLQHLELHWMMPALTVADGGSCPALTTLTSLTQLSLSGRLGPAMPLGGLTALQRLRLWPMSIISLEPQLPPSVTALQLSTCTAAQGFLLPQVVVPDQLFSRGAANLRSLCIEGEAGPLVCANWQGVAGVVHSLRHLRVRNFDSLPTPLVAALRSLTNLELLELIDLRGEGDHGAPPAKQGLSLGAALADLRRVTGLVVHNVLGFEQLYNHPPPAQLSSLRQLTALHYAVYAGGECPGGLPPGAWQGRLQQLAIEERLLHASRACIEGLEALEALHIKWYVYPDCRVPGGRTFGAAKWSWVWEWAEAHAALRTLCFDVGDDELPSGFDAARGRLLARRPGLRVECGDFGAVREALGASWHWA